MSNGLTIGALALTLGLGSLNLQAQDQAPVRKVQDAVVRLAISGLTEQNASELQDLMKKGSCSGEVCPMTKAAAKSCGDGGCTMETKDNMDKMACFTPVVKSCTIDGKKGEVALAIEPGKKLTLSQVEAALAKSNFRVDHKRLRLAKDSTLVVSGMSCGGCSGKVSGMLEKVTGPVKVAFESREASPVQLTTARADTLYADAVKTMADSQFTIKDVVWTAPVSAAEGCCEEGEKAAADCCEDSAPAKPKAKAAAGCCEEGQKAKAQSGSCGGGCGDG